MCPIQSDPVAPPCGCRLFTCNEYRVELTHDGRADWQRARVHGIGALFGRSWPRHRWCAWNWRQPGRAVAAQLPARDDGNPERLEEASAR